MDLMYYSLMIINNYDNLVKVHLMLYADDRAIFSNDTQGLQTGLDCFHLYCYSKI